MDYHKQGKLLKALSHPIRLQITEGLLRDECNVNKIVECLQLPQSTISQHLGVLRNAGVLQIRKEGVKTCYHIADSKIPDLIKLLNK